MTTEALTQHHPRLPLLLDVLSEHFLKSVLQLFVDGAAVRASLNYWTAPLRVRDDLYLHHYILGVQRVYYHASRPDIVRLRVEKYDVVAQNQLQSPIALAIAPRDFRCALSTYITTMTVPTTEMEAHYPDWLTRWTTGASLGYQDAELAAYVCSRPAPDTSLTLDHLAFD